MFNLKPYVTYIAVGNNATMFSFSKGNDKVSVVQNDGSTISLTVQDGLLLPHLVVNLFSIAKAKGVQLLSKGEISTLHINQKDIFRQKLSSWFWPTSGN
jgi:hypothetical protein